MVDYDVIVIGGGHAGCEAAHASARLGCKVALVTLSNNNIGQMSCNPAIGGIGKSHLAREIDALDGLICKIADMSALQRRKLNARKGPAVQATRIQTCRDTYKTKMQETIHATPNINVIEATASSLIIKNNVVMLDNENNTINTEYAEYNENNKIFTSRGPTTIITSEKYILEGKNITLNNEKRIIFSKEDSILKDQDGNRISLINFEYLIEKNIFKSLGLVNIKDKIGNSYNFSQIYIDTKKKEILGTDIKAFLNNQSFKINERE